MNNIKKVLKALSIIIFITVTLCLLFSFCSGIIRGTQKIKVKAYETAKVENYEAIESLISEDNILYEGFAISTAYNPVEEQTNSNPEINARGLKVKQGDIACPRDIPFGSIVEMSGYFFICNDRMNIRYEKVAIPAYDILMFSKSDAISFGRKLVYLKVYKVL